MLANETNLLTAIIDAFMAQSGWEWIAAALGTLYVILAARQSVWCWPAAFISTLIYTVLFWEGQLPMQAILNFYYMAMAVYGYLLWKQVIRINKQNDKEELPVTTRSWLFHASYIISGLALSFAIGYYLESLGTNLPYLDAVVTVFSVMTTVLMARKVLENWLYWIVIDSLAIVLYWQSGFYVTIAMFTVYLILAVYGYRSWLAANNIETLDSDNNNRSTANA